MELDNRYGSLSEAVRDLRSLGYEDELNLTVEGVCHVDHALPAEDFNIDSYHRFEGPSDPADMSILYAVSSERHQLKGLLINAYGTYASHAIDHVLVKLGQSKEIRMTRPVRPADRDELVIR